jgi:twitching motility protein PilT
MDNPTQQPAAAPPAQEPEGKTIDVLLQRLLQMGGSDLHIISGLAPAARVNGHLSPFPGMRRLTPQMARDIIYEVLSPEQIQRFETDPASRNELDFAYGVAGMGRFRFNVHRARGSVCCTVRALSSKLPNLDDLNLHPTVRKLCDEKKGMILVTGPTGSGKSTTLAAIIDYMNANRAEHILTIEDPIEYVHNSKKAYVTQREVGPEGDTLTFRNALKYALRQDPDVILIGEMRDFETIGIAITSAETGHLVMGTLHTSSAAQTVGRIIDVFPTDQQAQVTTQLASNLVAVLSQVLIPKLDGKGRVMAMEIMLNTAAIRNNIQAGKVESINQTMSTAQGQGMQSMDKALLDLARKRLVAYADIAPYLVGEVSHREARQLCPPMRPGQTPNLAQEAALGQAPGGQRPQQQGGPDLKQFM